MSTETGVDLSAYLDRIGHRADPTPTLSTLNDLIAAHLRHIPFENIDPLMGVPVTDLDAAGLQRKLVERRRGGYCYEQNGLFRHVLTAVGFEVDLLAGRVVWMHEPGGALPAETHQLLAVRIPGDPQEYLVDVGFGGQTPSAALRFVVDEEQPTDLEPFRITAGDDARFWRMESLVGDRWRPTYLFGSTPRPDIDSVVGSWFVSTHPGHHFQTGLTASIIADDARWNLRGRNLAVHRADGSGDKRRLDTARDVLTLLTERFGIDIDGIDGLEARVAEVLDS
ncbi:arylamine N-acetyltransferase [Gordonia sp. CPCC 206044]|uniref:arylamine N-acetyltransferase family protein n=1 Tax=Gordonia sp. CPCC 206044 TaxID=3140793 RepID=UPI003AF4084A